MTPRVGQTVRITTGLWAGQTGTVVDHWASGAVAVELTTAPGLTWTRTFNPDEYEATE